MTIDLKRHFKKLEADVDDLLSKRQNQELKINKAKETIAVIAPLLDRTLQERISLYKDTLSAQLITPSSDTYEWLFYLDKLNYSVKLRLSINKSQIVNAFLPEGKIDFIYFVKDFKFAKIAHKDIFHNNDLNEESQKIFEGIDESKIECILSVDDFATEILNEVIYNFRLKIEETRKIFYDNPFV